MPGRLDYPAFVDPEEPVPSDLLHRPEDVERTAAELFSLTARLQPLAELAVYEALQRQTLESGMAGLVMEARQVLASLLAEPDALDELGEEEDQEQALRAAVAAAMLEVSHEHDAEGLELLRGQAALRAEDLARRTAGVLVEFSAGRRLQGAAMNSGDFSIQSLDDATLRAITESGGLDQDQARAYLEGVHYVLTEDSIHRQEEAAALYHMHDRAAGQ